VGVNVDHERARHLLDHALELGLSDDALPVEWTVRTHEVGLSPCKTYVAVFGTILLAKASNPAVDVFALKATTASPGAYGPRMLSEQVLVPFAVNNRIHLGSRGRQPWNNQPWFRYDVAEPGMRIAAKCRSAFEYLLSCFARVAELTDEEAFMGLAAFLRERRQAEAAYEELYLGDRPLTLRGLIGAAASFISSDPEGGKRGQAVTAAAFDLVFTNVDSAGINDPSRHWPGDVQIFGDAAVPVQCCEVRQKPVSSTDVLIFCQALQKANVRRGTVVMLDPSQLRLDGAPLAGEAEARYGLTLTLLTGVDELLRAAMSWSNQPVDEAMAEFVRLLAERLVDIEAGDATVAEWQRLVLELTGE
jgi:hypothetical protein